MFYSVPALKHDRLHWIKEITVLRWASAFVIEMGWMVTREAIIWSKFRSVCGETRHFDFTGNSDSLLLSAIVITGNAAVYRHENEAQTALQWPRDEVYIDGYYIESTTIPQSWKQLKLWQRDDWCRQRSARSNASKTVREKPGPIEVTVLSSKRL